MRPNLVRTSSQKLNLQQAIPRTLGQYTVACPNAFGIAGRTPGYIDSGFGSRFF